MNSENMLNNETTSMADKQATTSQNTTPASPQTQSNSGGGNYDPATQGNWEIMAKKMEDHDNRIADVEKDVDTNKLIMDLKDDVYELKDTVNKLALDTNEGFAKAKDNLNKLALDTKEGFAKAKDNLNKLALDTNDRFNNSELKNRDLFNKAMEAINKLALDIKEDMHKLERKNDRQFILLLMAIVASLFGAVAAPYIISWLMGS